MTRRTVLALLCCATALAGCTGEPAPMPSPTPSVDASAIPQGDPDREALEATLGELGTTIAQLRTALEAAAGGDADALATAADLLVADVEAATDPDVALAAAAAQEAGDVTPPEPADDPAPLLPGPLSSRAQSIQYGDLLTRTLAAGRGAGSTGEPALRFLADPFAGDLGAWQRAPADQLAAIATAGTAGDLATTEVAVLELDGEAPRALAWVVHGLTVPSDVADAAGRALAHLTVIDLALDQLTAPDDGADG